MDSLVKSSNLSANAPEFVPSGMISYEVRNDILLIKRRTDQINHNLCCYFGLSVMRVELSV